MSALGLSLADVTASLSAQNTITGTGRVADFTQLYLVLVDNRLTGIEDLRDTPLIIPGREHSSIVRLGDIVPIERARQPNDTLVNSGGQDARKSPPLNSS